MKKILLLITTAMITFLFISCSMDSVSSTDSHSTGDVIVLETASGELVEIPGDYPQDGIKAVLETFNNPLVLEGEKGERIRPDDRTVIYPGTELRVNQNFISPDGKRKLVFQSDGNLVLYDKIYGNRWVWMGQTHTYDHNPRPDWCIFQADGNLVLYKGSQPIWYTNSFSSWCNLNVPNVDWGYYKLFIYLGPGPVTIWGYHGHQTIFPGIEL